MQNTDGISDIYNTKLYDVRIPEGILNNNTENIPSVDPAITSSADLTTTPELTSGIPTQVVPDITPEQGITGTGIVTPIINPSLTPSTSPEITDEISPVVTPQITEIVTPTLTDIVTPSITQVPLEDITQESTLTPTDMTIEDPYAWIFETYTTEELLYDEDDDHLPLYVELIFGTNPKEPDTDHDGIDDAIEIVNGLDPITIDEEFNGDSDIDRDGLPDYQEIYEYLTDPFETDTDKDGLKDGFEILHGFDPLAFDTDRDGLPDGEERFEQTKKLYTDDLGYRYRDLVSCAGSKMEVFGEETYIPLNIGAIKNVTVTASVSGDIDEKFNIENLYGEDTILTYSPGMVGVPFDIKAETEFDSAVIAFEYNRNLLGDSDENDLRIAWYNEEEGMYEVFVDSVLDIDNSIISCQVEHFSKYLVLDIKEMDESWRRCYAATALATRERQGKNTVLINIDTGTDFFHNNAASVRESIKRFEDARVDNPWSSGKTSDQIAFQTICYKYIKENEPGSVEDIEGKYIKNTVEFGYEKNYGGGRVKKYTDALSQHEHFCRVGYGIDAIKDYVEKYGTGIGDGTIVWITSGTFSTKVASGAKDFTDWLKMKGIHLEYVHIGKIIETYEEEMENLVGITKGMLFEVDEEASLDGIFNLINNRTKDRDVLIVFDSGAQPIKDTWDETTSFVRKLVEIESINSLGFMDIYETSVETGSSASGTGGYWGDFYYIGMPMDGHGRETISQFIDRKIVAEGSKSHASFEYKAMSEYFDYFSDWDDVIYKDVVMISANTINKTSYAKIFDKAKSEGIRLFLIYVGEKITSLDTEKTMRELFQSTGGDMFCLSDEIFNRDGGATDKRIFDDIMSIVIARTIGRSDSQDSDGDGLTDCRELNGMVIPDNKVVQTDSHNADTDGDGLNDGEEMGVGTKLRTYVHNNAGDNEDYSDPQTIEGKLAYIVPMKDEKDIFTVFSGYRSNPTKVDTDDDGYGDNGVCADTHPLVSDVHIYAIKDSEKYVPIYKYMSDGKTLEKSYYGGNQSWFENLKGDQGKTIDSKGCGLMASLNLLLYLALNEEGYITNDINSYFHNIDKGVVGYYEFLNWGLELSKKDAIFDYTKYDKFGIWGFELSDWIELYYKNIDISIEPEYLDYEMDDLSKEKVVDEICEMLSSDKPVPFEIGVMALEIPYEDISDALKIRRLLASVVSDSDKTKKKYDMLIQYLDKNSKKIFEIGNKRIYLYDNIGNEVRFSVKKDAAGKEVYTDKHWLTITKLIIDDISSKKWIKVQSWGEYYYINLDDWLNNQYGSPFDCILKISEF